MKNSSDRDRSLFQDSLTLEGWGYTNEAYAGRLKYFSLGREASSFLLNYSGGSFSKRCVELTFDDGLF
jgi:peptidoglycan/xylan/chitin deacetylase (PgdA/CDA1 family)